MNGPSPANTPGRVRRGEQDQHTGKGKKQGVPPPKAFHSSGATLPRQGPHSRLAAQHLLSLTTCMTYFRSSGMTSPLSTRPDGVTPTRHFFSRVARNRLSLPAHAVQHEPPSAPPTRCSTNHPAPRPRGAARTTQRPAHAVQHAPPSTPPKRPSTYQSAPRPRGAARTAQCPLKVGALDGSDEFGEGGVVRDVVDDGLCGRRQHGRDDVHVAARPDRDVRLLDDGALNRRRLSEETRLLTRGSHRVQSGTYSLSRSSNMERAHRSRKTGISPNPHPILCCSKQPQLSLERGSAN